MTTKKHLTVLAAIAAGVLIYGQQRKGSLTADDYIHNMAIDSGDEACAGTFVPDGVFNNFNGHDAAPKR